MLDFQYLDAVSLDFHLGVAPASKFKPLVMHKSHNVPGAKETLVWIIRIDPKMFPRFLLSAPISVGQKRTTNYEFADISFFDRVARFIDDRKKLILNWMRQRNLA